MNTDLLSFFISLEGLAPSKQPDFLALSQRDRSGAICG
jgi:hypothetical protein